MPVAPGFVLLSSRVAKSKFVMRHGKKVNHLSRKSEHRKSLLKNLAIALITHKRINTTLAKARALRVFLEPIITKAKNNTMHSRRVIFSYLQNKEAIKELFGPVATEVANRPGGYLRIIKTGFRRGDASEMAMIEFVDFNQVYSPKNIEEDSATKKRRSRRGTGKKKDQNESVSNKATKETALEEQEIEVDTMDDNTTESQLKEDSEEKQSAEDSEKKD